MKLVDDAIDDPPCRGLWENGELVGGIVIYPDRTWHKYPIKGDPVIRRSLSSSEIRKMCTLRTNNVVPFRKETAVILPFPEATSCA